MATVAFRVAVQRWWPTALMSMLAFGAAFTWRHLSNPRLVAADLTPPSASAPDSAHLAAMGINPGRELVAYVFLASRCSHCQRSDLKAALREVRSRLWMNEGANYRSINVVAVLVESNITEGLTYLASIGASSFDEISLGRAWQNEQVLRWAWREHVAETAVPQVVLVRRDFAATFRPFELRYGADSVLAAFSGRRAVMAWVRRGATVRAADDIARGALSADSTGTTRATMQ